MPSFVRLDMFPAAVTVGDTVYEPSRAIVTDDSVYVYVDGSGSPELAYQARLDDFSGRRTTGYTLLADDGTSVAINRGKGCGCGSRLRGFRPFAGIPQVSTQ